METRHDEADPMRAGFLIVPPGGQSLRVGFVQTPPDPRGCCACGMGRIWPSAFQSGVQRSQGCTPASHPTPFQRTGVAASPNRPARQRQSHHQNRSPSCSVTEEVTSGPKSPPRTGQKGSCVVGARDGGRFQPREMPASARRVHCHPSRWLWAARGEPGGVASPCKLNSSQCSLH